MKCVTIDTNILVSALQYGGACARFLAMARHGEIRLDVSERILDEMVHVLRDKFAWDGYRLHHTRAQIASVMNVVRPTLLLDVVKDDPDDNSILECAVTAGSEWVVTHDKHLLRIGEYEGIKIMRLNEFLAGNATS